MSLDISNHYINCYHIDTNFSIETPGGLVKFRIINVAYHE